LLPGSVHSDFDDAVVLSSVDVDVGPGFFRADSIRVANPIVPPSWASAAVMKVGLGPNMAPLFWMALLRLRFDVKAIFAGPPSPPLAFCRARPGRPPPWSFGRERRSLGQASKGPLCRAPKAGVPIRTYRLPTTGAARPPRGHPVDQRFRTSAPRRRPLTRHRAVAKGRSALCERRRAHAETRAAGPSTPTHAAQIPARPCFSPYLAPVPLGRCAAWRTGSLRHARPLCRVAASFVCYAVKANANLGGSNVFCAALQPPGVDIVSR